VKHFFTSLRQTAIAGIFFLSPPYVAFIVTNKAWKSLTVMGSKLAAMVGVKAVLGVGATTVFSVLLSVAIWLACGLLVRFLIVTAFGRAVGKAIASLIPGHASYRVIAEEKLKHKVRILPYSSALLKQQDGWRPAFVVEKRSDGCCVLFLPNTPETHSGQILVARLDQVRLVPSLRANELDRALKRVGKGLLSEGEIREAATSRAPLIGNNKGAY
jgi:hypothetical protein